MQLGEFVQGGFRGFVRAGDEFNLRLTKVGGDARVRQRRTQRRWMRRKRQQAAGLGTQAFFFEAPAHAFELLGGQRLEAVRQQYTMRRYQWIHNVLLDFLDAQTGVEVITGQFFMLWQAIYQHSTITLASISDTRHCKRRHRNFFQHP